MTQPPVDQRPPRPAGPAHAPRSGAHRPRRPVWHDILPAAAVLVAVLAVILAFFQLKDSVLGTASTGSSSSDPGPEDQQSAAPTAPVSTTASSSPSGSATGSPTSTAKPKPTVIKGAKVTVYNSTSRSGLAKGAATKLDGDGWTASSGGNQSFSGSTTVFYTRPALVATAKAIAQDLGGGFPTKLSTAYGSSGVIVILGNDYSG